MVEIRGMLIFCTACKTEMVTIRQQIIPRAAMGSGIPDGEKSNEQTHGEISVLVEAVSWIEATGGRALLAA